MIDALAGERIDMSTLSLEGVSPTETEQPNLPQSPLRRITIVLFPVRLFLALGWLRAGAAKLIDQAWWTGDYIRTFLDDHTDSMLPFLTPASAVFDSPVAALVAFVVLVAEFAVAACILTGRKLRPALWAACVLNVSFVLFGAVSPSAFYLVLQMALLFALSTARPAPPLRHAVSEIVGWIAVALAAAPFIATLHPADVIEDPAIMLATLAALRAATLTVLVVEHRWHGS